MPRAEPTTYDATAMVFLDAAAELIDAALTDYSPRQISRVRALKFPPALDWIRVEDVITSARLRHDGPAPSKKAFTNRWPTKDAFIRDAIVHAMLYRDDTSKDPRTPADAGGFFDLKGTSFAGEILASADALYTSLLQHPRSYLLAHIGPVLSQLPDLQAEVRAAAAAALGNWASSYGEVLRGVGIRLRPGWTKERLALALQSILDGFVLRNRISPEEMLNARWGTASLFADTVLAFVGGAVDPGDSGVSTHAWLDRLVPMSGRHSEPEDVQG